ncbi:DUF3347 domain-containing protein [Aquimarina sp. 2-A2]|uniref:DUF3347 domain-containing protein n=1 Tax=Aquimarina sp. 2-A2 TaxID=3382644 RepID=UPI0038901361
MIKRMILKTTVLLAGSILFFSCAKEKKTHETQVNHETVEAVEEEGVNYNATDDRTAIKFENEMVSNLYTHYLAIKGALVNSNPKDAMTHAKALSNMISEDENFKQLKATAELMALTTDIAKQRDFFSTLTDETIKVIGQAKIASGEVYKQFCPMAFDGNGGYWLSDSKEIRNPYYGNRMLKCGSVKATIE